MKKVNGLVLSTLTAAFLVGCGGGGGSSSSSSGSTSGGTTTPALTSTDVTVERGAVYGATVTDANGQVAVQKAGTNIYVFATTPVYPITASGGIIDVDNNGIDEGDIELTTVLTSYSNVVTPITTYLGNPATDSGKAKLAKLKEITGVTSDDDFFKKAPSELLDDIGTNVLVLTNALFDIMNDGDSTNDDFVSSYTGSAFETKFTELKTEALKYTDKKEMAKALEEKVVTNLGLTKLETKDLANTTTTTTLKVADLTRFVSYENAEDWYDDNTVADGKLTFKSYDYKHNSMSLKSEWVLEEENDYVTITPDATNPYRFSYVDPISKEEGTFTILSTSKVANYSDLYKTEAKIEVTKKATELVWDKWDWETPGYWDDTTQKQIPITDITGLVKMFTIGNHSLGLDGNTHVFFASDGTMVNGVKNQSGSLEKSTTIVGSWKQEVDYIVATIGTEIRYFKFGSENSTYYVSEAEMREVGNIDNETIYTGTSLDEFVNYIKAPEPEFTSDYFVSAAENQTNAYTATVTDTLKVTYSLSGTDASLFAIDSATGVVTFVTAPDYESTTHKPFYNFIVKATNSANKSSSQSVMLNVTDVNEQTGTTISVSDILCAYKFEDNTNDAIHYDLNIFSSNSSYPSSLTPSFVEGKYGKALDLSNSKFKTDILLNVPITNNFSKGVTISLWVKTDSLSAGKILSINHKDTVSSNTSKLGIDLYYPSHSGWKFALSLSNSSNHYEVYPSNEAEITANTWYHIVYTVDPTGKARVWYNGVEGIGAQIDNPEFLTWDLSNYKLQVGSVGEGADFSGAIDDLIIYKNVLTDDEIKYLYGKEITIER